MLITFLSNARRGVDDHYSVIAKSAKSATELPHESINSKGLYEMDILLHGNEYKRKAFPTSSKYNSTSSHYPHNFITSSTLYLNSYQDSRKIKFRQTFIMINSKFIAGGAAILASIIPLSEGVPLEQRQSGFTFECNGIRNPDWSACN